jgi:hypothetical protein
MEYKRGENAHDERHKGEQIRAEFNPKRKGVVLAKRFGKVTEAFKKGKTSGNYATHEEMDEKEKGYRAAAKQRALSNMK